MKSNLANKILQETESGYDKMSEKFSQTRKFFWRGMEFIKDYVHDGDSILDFGCGNGRLLDLFTDKKLDYLGLDPSQKLINLAKNKYPNENFSKFDPSQSSLALEDNYFNTIYSIAVFHHFPSFEYRKKMAEELYRITKQDGQIVITVWNLWPALHLLRRGKQKIYFKNILKNWLDKILGKSKLDWNDCYITFKNNQGENFSRFHHAFTKRELKKFFEAVGFQTEMCKVINGRNIIYIGKK